MQFLWPFKADYVIMHYDSQNGHTVIGHSSQKYAWIMSRSLEISDQDYSKLKNILEEASFDLSQFKRLPQNWTKDQDRLDFIRKNEEQGRLSEAFNSKSKLK